MRFVQSWACDNYIKLLTSDNAATRQRNKDSLNIKIRKTVAESKGIATPNVALMRLAKFVGTVVKQWQIVAKNVTFAQLVLYTVYCTVCTVHCTVYSTLKSQNKANT